MQKFSHFIGLNMTNGGSVMVIPRKVVLSFFLTIIFAVLILASSVVLADSDATIDKVIVNVDGTMVEVDLEDYGTAYFLGEGNQLFDYLKGGRDIPLIHAIRSGDKFIDINEYGEKYFIYSNVSEAIENSEPIPYESLLCFYRLLGFDSDGEPILEKIIITVVKVDRISVITVPVNTAFEDIGLPETIGITLSDNTRREDVGIDWSEAEGNYNSNLTGIYELEGELDLPEDIDNPFDVNPLNLKAEANVLVYDPQEAEAEIVSVEPLDDIEVDLGTAYDDIYFPSTVQTTLDNNWVVTIDANWPPAAAVYYDGNTSGTYPIEGELDPPTGITNPGEVKPEVNVIVGETGPKYSLELSVNPPGSGTVEGGGEYPAGAEIAVTASPNPGYEFDKWTRNGNLESNLAQFIFTMPSENVTLNANFNALPLEVESVDNIDLITVQVNTAFEDISLPETIGISLSDNTRREDIGIDWSEAEGNYNSNLTGIYELEGELDLPDDIDNPLNIKAIANVFVYDPQEPEAEVVSVESLDDIEVNLGTVYDDINFPSKVQTTLDNNSIVSLNVNWPPAAAVNYDGNTAGTYPIEGELELPAGIINPGEVKPEVNVIVGEEVPKYTLELVVDPQGSGTVEGGGEYPAGAEIAVTASPNPGYEFDKWTRNGNLESNLAQFIFTMPSENVTLVAHFNDDEDPVFSWPEEMEGEPRITYIDLIGKWQVKITIKDAYVNLVNSVTILGEEATQTNDDKSWYVDFDQEITLADLEEQILINRDDQEAVEVIDMTKSMARYVGVLGDTYVRVYLKQGEEAITVTADGTPLSYNDIEDRWQSGALYNYTPGDTITIVATTAEGIQTVDITVVD